MQFNQIIGQSATKNKLLASIQEGRVPHAQIFVGPEGAGALPLALAFAQRMVCLAPTEQDSCGKCSGCVKAAKYIHPDIHFSYPTIGSKIIATNLISEWRDAINTNPYLGIYDWYDHLGAENKQGNINKDECNNIIHKLNLKSFESDNRILVMWMPEFLGKEGNRLLKLIEEPPDNTYFVLVAVSAEDILGTILSRCQLVKVPPMKAEVLAEVLEAKHGQTNEKAISIAHLANGSYNQAQKMVQELGDNSAHIFLDWMRKSWKGNGNDIIGWVNDVAGIGREPQKYFLQYGLHFLRECLVLPWQGAEQARLQPEILQTAQKMRQVLNWQQIADMSKLLDEVSYHVERNANPKILFTDASLKLHSIFKS